MQKENLVILLKPNYGYTAKKLGLDPTQVYDNDPILFQQGFDIEKMEVAPGRVFSIYKRFEHGEISFEDVRYTLKNEEQDEFEDEFDEMDEDGLILKPGKYIFHSDGITIEPTSIESAEDEDEEDTNEEQLVFNAITDSAKRRFDYEGFEDGFKSFDPIIAHNILLETIILLATGRTPTDVSANLFSKLLVSGLAIDKLELDEFVNSKLVELKLEIHIAELAIKMLQDGANPLAVLDFVQKRECKLNCVN